TDETPRPSGEPAIQARHRIATDSGLKFPALEPESDIVLPGTTRARRPLPEKELAMRSGWAVVPCLGIVLVACAPSDSVGVDEGNLSSLKEGTPEALAVVALVNDPRAVPGRRLGRVPFERGRAPDLHEALALAERARLVEIAAARCSLRRCVA